MQSKVFFVSIALLLVVALYNTWMLQQIRFLKQDGSSLLLNEPSVIDNVQMLPQGQESKFTPVADLEVELAKPAPPAIRIPIYTKPTKEGVIFTTFNLREDLLISRRVKGWAEVIGVKGFPVWVRQDMVEQFNSGYVRVLVHRANARSSAGMEKSVPLGKLSAGDILKVSQRRDDWVRVWSPIRFKAWVKLSDLQDNG